jgi:hypothetical protein
MVHDDTLVEIKALGEGGMESLSRRYEAGNLPRIKVKYVKVELGWM